MRGAQEKRHWRMPDLTGQHKAGRKLSVLMPGYHGDRRQVFNGTIAAVYPNFLVLDTGKYKVTVLAADLVCGNAKLIDKQRP